MKNKIALAVIAAFLWGCDRSDEASPEPEVAVTEKAAPAAPAAPSSSAAPAPTGSSERCCQTDTSCNLGNASETQAKRDFEDQCSASGGVTFLGSDLKCESNACVEHETAFTRPQL